MSYQVLARKWRPQTFANVVGQKHVLTALANGLSLGRIHHAYLLSGTRGVGKTTIARLIAKGLNCETGITATPCGQCYNCCEIEQGHFVDLIEIDAASRTKVEDTRDLLDNLQYAPARGRFKVYIIDEIHMLSRHSFNALLKTLEEPPAHVKFLLATTDPQKLPVTILSRCLQFHLKALDVEQICGQLSMVLQQEHIAAAPRALQLLARAADGSMRDALSLTDQAIAMGQGEVSAEAVSLMLGTLNTEQPLALIEALADANGGAMMAQLTQYAARGLDWETLLLEMLFLLHRLAMGQLLPDQLNEEKDPAIMPRLRELARRIPPADLQLYYQILLIGRKELLFAPTPRMGVEMTLLRALAFHPTKGEAVNAEKKTAEFCHDAGQDSPCTSAYIASWAATSTDRVTSYAGMNAPPMVKLSPSAAPVLATLANSNRIDGRLTASNKTAVSQGGDGNFTASDRPADFHGNDEHFIASNIASFPYGCGHFAAASVANQTGSAFRYYDYSRDRAGVSPSPDTVAQNADASYVAGQAALANKPGKGISARELALIGGQQPSLPSGSATVTRQATIVDSANESLMQAYATSGLDDDDAQIDWQPDAITQLLQARTALLQHQESQKIKKATPPPACQKVAISALERLATVGKRAQQHQPATGRDNPVKAPRQEAYRWRVSQQLEAEPALGTTPKELRTALEHEKTPELALSMLELDPWAAQVYRLAVPKLVQQLALNTWKEDLAPGKICLHLRASQCHLNSAMAQNDLCDALSADLGAPVELTVMKDDNPAIKTPLEWCQAIYEEKLMRAREAMMNDSHIQMLRRFFDAELDEDSIRPV